MARSKTIIITGGAGSLGSRTALALESAYPGTYHLILTVREPNAPLAEEFSAAGMEYSWEAIDLSSLTSVKDFVKRIRIRLTTGDLMASKLAGIINSAALTLYSRGKKTADGFDPIYEINVLSALLLTIELLPLMGERSVVVNVSSATHNLGKVEYFWDEKAKRDWIEQKEKDKIGLKEGLTRYGSSKLLALMTGFKLQKMMDAKFPSKHIQIVGQDPGGMKANSRLGEQHWFLGITVRILNVLGPVANWYDPSAYNNPTVPAKCIAERFVNEGNASCDVAGKYFILNKETATSFLSQDVEQQNIVWDHVLQDLSLDKDQIEF